MLDEIISLFTDILAENNARRRRQYAIGLGLLCLMAGLCLLLFVRSAGRLPIAYALILVGAATLAATAWYSGRQGNEKKASTSRQRE